MNKNACSAIGLSARRNAQTGIKMKVIKSFFIAFSIYSKIPVPQLLWKEEDMKYTLCFFPCIGYVIGISLYAWRFLCDRFSVGETAYLLFAAAIPLLVTGGFHVDGFIDTMDAFHSYQPREKKLQILKDSHIGAFAIIGLVTYGLVYLACFFEAGKGPALTVICAGFALSRCLSGIGVVCFPSAKKEGTLFFFADTSQKRVVKAALFFQGICCVVFMLQQSFLIGMAAAGGALASFGYYYYRTKKELGGITGDTAGYFILLCEGSITAAAAVVRVLTAAGR